MTTKTWWYVSKYVAPQKTLQEIWKNNLTNYGAFAKATPFRAALNDLEDGVHSLIEKHVCSCGLRLKDPNEILESPNHRNHTSLSPEPNPKFRGRVHLRLNAFTNRENPVDAFWNKLVEPHIDHNLGREKEPFRFDGTVLNKTWWYVDKYVRPKATLDLIDEEFGIPTSSPVAYGKWARSSIYRVALKDVEENLHSLIEKRTCSCGLKLREDQDPKSILTNRNHRNHTTLEHEPNPKFRGKVGQRITMPLQPTDWQHSVDRLWDEIVVNYA